MGVVYQARDPFIGRLVALKTITSAVATDTEHLDRFRREAQAAGGLHHSNIVTIYEMGVEDGVPYLVMEYLDGEGLDHLIGRRAAVSFLEKFSCIVQLCRALQHAHENGVVHRDVKPANVVVKRDGTIRVVDFGIARLVDTTRTQTGVVMGTIGYMSPQQLHGQRADDRSDIYAAGVVAYELIGGKRPFCGENHGALILDILSRTPEPFASVAPGCPADLVAIIERAMHKEDAQRYQSMRTMLAEMEPVWKREQERGVNQLMEHAQNLLEKEDYSGARKQLDRILRIDRESATAAVLLEELRCAREGLVLQQEVIELVERGRRYLEQGLFSDALADANSALQLDPNSKGARDLLADAQEIESAANRALQDASERVPVLEHEYMLQGSVNASAARSSHSSIPFAEAQPIAATVHAGAPSAPLTGPDKRMSSGTIVAPQVQSRPRRRVLPWVASLSAGALLLAVLIFARGFRKNSTLQPPIPPPMTVNSAAPAAGSIEDRQRALMEQAHEAADQNDYATARSRLEDAERLGGPLGPRIDELRQRFASEEQNIGLRALTRQESDLWSQAQRAMQQDRFDEAGKAFASILELPEGGRRREDADHWLHQVIPERREEQSLFAKVKAMQPGDDPAALRQEVTFLDRVISLNGSHRSEAEQLRQQVSNHLAAVNSRTEPPPAPAATRAAVTLSPSSSSNATAPVEGGASKPADRQLAKAPELAAFQAAVEHFNKASGSRDVTALKGEIVPEFQRIAQGGGTKSADAQRYLNSLIPAAVRSAMPWPAIGCPTAPSGLVMSVKPGDTVACGLLDPPRLTWTQFTWPEWVDGGHPGAQQNVIAMLSLSVDENGNVVEVRPRSKPSDTRFTEAAVAAAHQWKTTPPRAQGKPVKTEFAVDLRVAP